MVVGYSPWGRRVGHDWVTDTFTFITEAAMSGPGDQRESVRRTDIKTETFGGGVMELKPILLRKGLLCWCWCLRCPEEAGSMRVGNNTKKQLDFMAPRGRSEPLPGWRSLVLWGSQQQKVDANLPGVQTRRSSSLLQHPLQSPGTRQPGRHVVCSPGPSIAEQRTWKVGIGLRPNNLVAGTWSSCLSPARSLQSSYCHFHFML